MNFINIYTRSHPIMHTQVKQGRLVNINETFLCKAISGQR